MRHENEELRTELQNRTLIVQEIYKVFTENQIRTVQSEKVCWTADELANAATLFEAGPLAYQWLLQQGYPFPPMSAVNLYVTLKSKKDIKKDDERHDVKTKMDIEEISNGEANDDWFAEFD